MTYVATKIEIDQRRFIPAGTLRTPESDRLYVVVEEDDPFHATALLWWKDKAEFWDGVKWRPVSEWNAWREQVRVEQQSVDSIPAEIVAAAKQVADYFAERNIKGWQLEGCADRWGEKPRVTGSVLLDHRVG